MQIYPFGEIDMSKVDTKIAESYSLKNMGQWKSKKLKKLGKGSRTTGKQKGITASALQKYMCRRGRSYKHPLYGEVMASLGARKAK